MSRIPSLEEKDVFPKRPTSGPSQSDGIDVTVVTVVFNAVKSGRAEAFRECLDSVQRQSGCAVEHVVVDGASKDGTLELVRDYANATVPMRVFSSPDAGIYEAMNRGIALARGTYVVFLNSDDFFNDSEGLSASVQALGRSGADFSYAPAVVIDEKGTVVPHAFSEGRPFQFSEGMTLCHQTMLTRRETLLAQDGFDTRYRSAADYDLLLRMVFAGCRGCRADRPFVTFRLGGFSAANADVCDREMGDVYARLFNSNLGTRLTAEEGLQIRRSGVMPEALACRLGHYARRTYGAWYRLSDAQAEGWRNLLAGQLQQAASDWSRRLRCPSALRRMLLGFRCRRSAALDEKEKAADLDFMYRYVQRVQPLESGIDLGSCVESKSGLASAKALEVSFVLNDWLRDRAVRLGLLLRVDATGCRVACFARVSCAGRELCRIRPSASRGLALVDIPVPASCNVGEVMKLDIELVGGDGAPLPESAGAALVYGGLAVWRKVV